MAAEQGKPQWRAKTAEDYFKVDVFQLGVVLFRLIFKAYPFEGSSVENSGVRDEKFIDNFINSETNVYKVSGIS